jgi:ferredoxin-NADP reductase
LHDQVHIGTLLDVRAPSGQFIFVGDPKAPPVFITGGIGITPILSMLKAALAEQPERAAHLFYGVRNSQDHAFKTDLRQLAQALAGLALHILYADPTAQDVQGQDHDLPGFISLDLLKQTLPHGRHAF